MSRDSHGMNPASCVGKAVFVTGAATGMGQATVVSFAAAGAHRVAIVDHVDASATRARALQAAVDVSRPAPEMLVLESDFCDGASVEAGVQEVSSRWGHVDVLVNNAVDLSQLESQPLEASDMDAWWRIWEVNVKARLLGGSCHAGPATSGNREDHCQCDLRRLTCIDTGSKSVSAIQVGGNSPVRMPDARIRTPRAVGLLSACGS